MVRAVWLLPGATDYLSRASTIMTQLTDYLSRASTIITQLGANGLGATRGPGLLTGD